jgi:hypothetical protein
MKLRHLPLIAILAGGSLALGAQETHFGVGLNLSIPTGGLSSTTYAPTAWGDGTVSAPTETFDMGVGAQFYLSVPADSKLAFRFQFSGQSEDGTNSAPGEVDLDIRHTIYSLGAGVEVFPGSGSAYRHKGTYLLAGLSADFETIDRSLGDSYYGWAPSTTTSKSRLGGEIGVGHSFSIDAGWRYTLEATYHKTLTGVDTTNGNMWPSADFVKVSFGVVF